MTDDLKSQLIEWENKNKAALKKKEAANKAAAKEPVEEDQNEAELFAQAVAGVDESAILKKYDRRTTPHHLRKKADKGVQDQALFLQFVEEMKPPEK